MHIGIILLGWLITAAVVIAGLLASGMLTIKIEKIDPDDDDWKDDEE